MITYYLSPEFIRKRQAKALWRGLLLSLVAAVAGGVAAMYYHGSTGSSELIFSGWRPLILFVLIAGGALAVGLREGMARLRRSLESYQLEVAGDSLTRYQDGVRDLTVLRTEDFVLLEYEGRGISMQTTDRRKVISIPDGLEGYGELRDILGQWKEIQAQPRSAGRWGFLCQCALTFSPLVAFLVVLVSDDPSVVVPAGILFLVGMTLGLVLIQRSRYIERWAKRGSWFVLFLFVVVLVKLYGAIVGGPIFGR